MEVGGGAQPACRRRRAQDARVPNLHGPKVGTIRIRVANVLHDPHLAFFPELVQVFHAWMQTDMIVKPQHFIFFQAQGRTVLVVGVIGIWNDCVQPVVPARQLDDDQDG